jgi:DNA-binding CsgD family transcriptional regulator
VGPGVAQELVGRDEDIAFVCTFVDSAAVNGGALLVSGHAGVGKTALLDVAARHAETSGSRVIRAIGAQFEAQLSFAGLNHVLHSLLDRLAALPPLQREALTVTLGLESGPPPERLVVSNAVVGLMRESAASQPLLVIVDDLPWLDRASALVLASAVRCLTGTHVGFLAALRTEAESFFDRAGLPTYELEPLDTASATALLAMRFPAMVPRVRDRLVVEAEGNPLALLELPVALQGASRADGRSPAVLPLTERLQELFESRIRGLPDATFDVLLFAVLDGTGDLKVLEAAKPAGTGLGVLAAAEHARVVKIDEPTARLTFRHPLIRSAIVALSTIDQRQRVHRMLADRVATKDLRAWHLSQAALGPDAQVASLIEEVALEHLSRGDAVRAVAAMSRAAELSPAASDQGRRWAQAAYIGATVLGDLSNASRALSELRVVNADHHVSLAGALAGGYHLLNGDGDVDTAHRLLVGAIEMVPEPTDSSNDLLVEAIYNLLEVCFFGGRAALWPPFRRAIGRLAPDTPRFLELLSKTIPDPARDAVGALETLDAAVADLAHESNPTRIVRTAVATSYIDRLPACRPALWRVVNDGRAGGAVTMAIQALALLGFDYYLTGQWEPLTQMTDEAVELCETHGFGLLRWPSRAVQALHAAARGDSAATRAITDEMIRWAVPRRAVAVQTYALHARALDAIGRNDFEAAFRDASAISPAGTIASHIPHAMWMVLDLVEAAVRTGRNEDASAHVAAARATGLPAISSRLALITAGAAAIATPDDDDAFSTFQNALDMSDTDQWPFDLARVQLLFGERLRRARSTSQSRELLTRAREIFQQLGARPWAERAASELRATGVKIGSPSPSSAASLSPQQLEIARLAADGLTNKEIGERLFLSHRTVGTHLYQLFPKLGITSRAELREALKDVDADV